MLIMIHAYIMLFHIFMNHKFYIDYFSYNFVGVLFLLMQITYP